MAKLLQMPLLFEDSAEPEAPDDALEIAPAPDAAQRAQALDIHRSWIVEAPAGSGKTGLLIQRFLKLLAHGDVEQPGQVLAITFTRKADAEMRRRVLGQLAAAAAGQPLPPSATPFERTTRRIALAALDRDRALGWRLLDAPQSLNIRTIDSLCAELASSTPMLAATGGQYTPTDDPEPLYAEAARRTLLLMGGADPVLTADLELLLLHRDAIPGDFSRLLADMLRGREQWGELIPLDPALLTEQALEAQVRPRLTRTLQRLLAQELQAAANLVGDDLLNSLAALAHTLSVCPPYNDKGPHPLLVCAQRSAAPGTHASDLEHWKCLADLVITDGESWRSGFNRNHLKLEASPAEKQELRRLVDSFRERERNHPTLLQTLSDLRRLPSAPYPHEAWQIVKPLCRVLRQALIELGVLFAERRTFDFSEVALTARTLMRSNPADLRQTAAGRLKHLLVDEMQDTSASQYELLETLTAGWDGVAQTLFLVGDPKQSIYEFRQARVERFLRVMREGRFGRLPVGALHLTANFRSQAALVDDFNSTFSQILPSPEALALSPDSGEVPFTVASCTRQAAATPALTWHFAVKDTNASSTQSGTAASQARQIRDIIEDHIARSSLSPERRLTPPSIAVLARNRSHLAPVIQEFHQDRGKGPLPFRAVDIEALGERPEILDLLALTRALLHPGDRVAWLALLRSPVCGLSLADLLALTGEGAEADPDATVPHLIATRAHHLSHAGAQFLHRAWSVLHQAVDDLGRTPLATHVERTWRSLGADGPLHPHERANARRFLDLLHELESGPDPLSPGLLNRRLRNLYAEPNTPDAAVELMTIHKAKGLEWDLVLTPSLHGGSGWNTHEFLKWLEFDTSSDAAAGADFLLAPIQSKGEESSDLSRWLNRRQCQREAAEAKRLLYVACTRAREELHLFAAVAFNASGGVTNPAANSLLKAAWPVAKLHPERPRPLTEPSAEVLAFSPSLKTEPAPEPLALAASAAGSLSDQPEATARTPPIRRLPLDVDPLSRFRPATGPLLAYPPASTLAREAAFARPESSFAARAFGNAVHRFLAFTSDRLKGGQLLAALQEELPSWEPRILAALRLEGLAPSQAPAEAQRVLKALIATLGDPAGAWLLSPQMGARNEATLGDPDASLRADRTFRAGPQPLETAPPTHLWIIDYKTAELGGRSPDAFLADQRAKYLAQMNAYALAARESSPSPDGIILALYFPLLPALVHWPATLQSVANTVTSV